MGRKIELDFVVTKVNGEAIRGFKNLASFDYIEGDGNMLPAIEQAVANAKEGDRLRVRVEPRDGFGDYLNTRNDTFPRSMLPLDPDLKEGDMILLPTQGFSNIAKVTAVDDKNITLDANHPLAGIPLVFHIEVKRIRPTH